MGAGGDDDDRPVEFVDPRSAAAPDAPGDELSNPRMRPGARWYLLLSAAVLIGAALIAGKVSSKDDDAAPTPSASKPTTTVNSIPGPTLDPSQCPGPTACTASAKIRVTVAAALLDAFPGARLGEGSDVYLRSGGLWFREVQARAGLLDILVRVQRPDRGTPLIQSGHDDRVAFVRRIEHGFLVQVQVAGPPDQLPPITNLDGLAADARLLDVG